PRGVHQANRAAASALAAFGVAGAWTARKWSVVPAPGRPDAKVWRPASTANFSGRWCNGSTADFGSVCPGSNPGRPVSESAAGQEQQVGTGHAVRCAEPLIQRGRDGQGAGSADIVILAGDGPLIRAQTLRMLLKKHRDARAAATLATAVIDDPTGYGRIVRDS